jgi:hypothetical protein
VLVSATCSHLGTYLFTEGSITEIEHAGDDD